MSKGLTDMELYLFDTTGILHVSGVLSPEEVESYRQELDTLEPAPYGFSNSRRYEQLADQSSKFRSLATDPRILDRVRDTINQPLRLIESYSILRQAGSILFLHGGLSEPMEYDHGVASRTMAVYHTYNDGRLYCMSVKALLYLTDITELEDGPFCFVQGSHKANYPLLPLRMRDGKVVPLAEVGFPTLNTLYVKAGDMVLLNEALMHGTHRKTSPQERALLAFTYSPSFASDWKPLERARDDIFESGYADADVEEAHVEDEFKAAFLKSM